MATKDMGYMTAADLFAADCLPCGGRPADDSSDQADVTDILPCGARPVWQDIDVSANAFEVIKKAVLCAIPDMARAKKAI
ncbi:MAG: hypothetical protein Q4A32_04685 [Lachnospiraceae bacterium]|nr:hypothetical protein [Lachnospiraceae bacterium]